MKIIAAIIALTGIILIIIGLSKGVDTNTPDTSKAINSLKNYTNVTTGIVIMWLGVVTYIFGVK